MNLKIRQIGMATFRIKIPLILEISLQDSVTANPVINVDVVIEDAAIEKPISVTFQRGDPANYGYYDDGKGE